jgi:hypothetical protein
MLALGCLFAIFPLSCQVSILFTTCQLVCDYLLPHKYTVGLGMELVGSCSVEIACSWS